MAQHRSTTQGLSVINGIPARLDGPSLLHELISSPSAATAIDFLEHGSKRRKLSYEALHMMSDTLAQRIVQVVARLEDASAIIPVLLPQSPELYIVLLAILKAGKAFCPLGLDTPSERLKFILKDISADILITNVAHGKDLDLHSNIIILQVEDELSHTEQHVKGTPSLSRTNNLAYVLYTSGSTGMPKAVSVSHRAVTQSLLAHDRHIPSFSRFLQFAAPTFDVSIFEIFFPWYRGRTLVGCTRAHMLGDLPETIRSLDIDAAELTPTVVSNLLTGRSNVPSLKLLLTIGEMLTQDVISEYGDSDEREGILWAMYGPTEASIHCTLQARLSATASIGAIGAPLDTVSAFIAAPLQQGSSPSTFTLLPLGKEGELLVGGPQIAEEYLHRPELTSASFIHHPDYGYLYRTGDRARLRSDGTLECSGRITTGQVKLKGQRVELGEIEQVIMKAGSCRAAVVLVVDEQLVAFCVTGPQQVLREDVERVCKRWLPEIMVPSQVVISHSMPQLSSGKVDKAALIAEHRRTVHCNGSSLANSDDVTDQTIFDILKRHLGQDVNMDTELATVGFDSLQAIRLASALRRQGYNLATLRILSSTTVGDIIAAADDFNPTNAGQHIDSTSLAEYQPEDIPELERWREKVAYTLPCTPLQEAMLAETIARPTAYCNWFDVEIEGSHTFADIQWALRDLARRNEILRSGFYPLSSGSRTFLQVVWKELEASQIREVQDFSHTYALETSESLLRPLSIQARICVGHTRLVFQAHHALYDGWSLDLIIQDLERILRNEDPPQRPQFCEVVRYHAQFEHSREADRQYWSDSLRDRRDLSLPNFNGEVVEGPVSRSIAGRSTVRPHVLIERSRELQINPQVFFQAAIAFVTSLYLGSTDVIIGNVTSGRTIPVVGVENIIGPCIASLPCRLHFDRLLQVRDVLNETQRLNRESLGHISLPLREITKAAKVPAGARLFDILFVWQQSLYSDPGAATSVRLVESADELEFKITLEYEPHPDHISFRATFDPTTIPESQAQNFSRQVDEVVHLFLDHPDYQTSAVSQCFTAASRSIANATPQQQPMMHGPAHAVEKWARATPDKEAIIFARNEEGAMQVTATATYSELNSRANQLARLLQERGVRPGGLVGVIMEKSVELYISILAVLKAGAGYLPLVPDLPDERLKAILSNAKVTVCMSDLAASTRVRQCTSAVVLCMDQIDLSSYSGHNIRALYDGSNIAYAVFTSGSTGTPKGVLVSQHNLMSNLDYLSTVYPYSASSRLLQACSQAFDVSVFEIFFSWHIGICLCTATKDDLFADLERAIIAMEITHLSLTPTVAALIDPDNVPCVRFLVTAGEAVTEHVRRQWAGRGLYQGQIYEYLLF
jgi:amino acid adenylation domain-containing protein